MARKDIGPVSTVIWKVSSLPRPRMSRPDMLICMHCVKVEEAVSRTPKAVEAPMPE